jgi:hypothetical protein
MKEFCAFLIIAFFIVSTNITWYNKGQENMLEKINERPSAMDVYQGKTALQYTVVDGVKIDSVVVFK